MIKKYNNVDVNMSRNRINEQYKKISEIIQNIEKNYEFDLDIYKWNCEVKSQLFRKINEQKQQMKLLLSKMDNAIKTLELINEIQMLTREINLLEEENEMLKSSTLVLDKAKMMENKKNIELNLEKISRLDNDIWQMGW